MVARRVGELLKEHVRLEIEAIDRMYLNGYVPGLQHIGGVIRFLRQQLGARYLSTAVIAPLTQRFVQSLERFALEQGVDVVTFRKDQRKDELAQEYLRRFRGREGILFVGKAQEKTTVFRTIKKTDAQGRKYPWIVLGTAMVNHYYVYLVDADFGPMFLKFGTYFPYPLKIYLNGHEWLKRQLDRRGLKYQPLDNGIQSAEDPSRVQALADQLHAARIEAVVRKWLARLPHPFRSQDRRAGYRYDLSILQAEFSLTQVLDRPQVGRVLFEEILRENLDLGRPDRIQLVFGRRVSKKTPGSFRTRVITPGVVPSLRVQYKHSAIKQYYKEDRALRTETTINDTRDFGIGKRLHNLPALREVGFQANRRLLDVQTTSHDAAVGEVTLEALQRPVIQGRQRASALRLGDGRVTAVLQVLLRFGFLPSGFSNRDLCQHLAPLLGLDRQQLKPGRITYELRRLRLHGLIQRMPHSHRYRLTERGLRVALFYARAAARLLRPSLSLEPPLRSAHASLPHPHPCLQKLEAAYAQLLAHTHLAVA